MTNTDNEQARMLAQSELTFYRSMLYAVEATLDALQSLRYDMEQDNEAANAKAIALADDYIAHEQRRLKQWQDKTAAYRDIVNTLS